MSVETKLGTNDVLFVDADSRDRWFKAIKDIVLATEKATRAQLKLNSDCLTPLGAAHIRVLVNNRQRHCRVRISQYLMSRSNEELDAIIASANAEGSRYIHLAVGADEVMLAVSIISASLSLLRASATLAQKDVAMGFILGDLYSPLLPQEV